MKATLKTLTLMSFLLLTNCASAYAGGARKTPPAPPQLTVDQQIAQLQRHCAAVQDLAIIVYESAQAGMPLSKILLPVEHSLKWRKTVLAVYEAQQQGATMQDILEATTCQQAP